MGDHHFSLQVLCDVPADDSKAAGSVRLKMLNDHVALARALLADTGMTVAREDLALEAAFWGPVAGQFSDVVAQGTDQLTQLCCDGSLP